MMQGIGCMDLFPQMLVTASLNQAYQERVLKYLNTDKIQYRKHALKMEKCAPLFVKVDMFMVSMLPYFVIVVVVVVVVVVVLQI